MLSGADLPFIHWLLCRRHSTRHSIELEHELHDVKSACRKLAEEKEGLLDAARDVQQSSTSREGWWNTQLGQLKVQLEQREVEVERLKQ